MNVQEVTDTLGRNHPGKKIIKLPEQNPTEIICELEPTSDHPEYSVAISVISSSEPHHHKTSTEEYRVVRGDVNLTVDGKIVVLHPGDSYIIKPGVVHSATGNTAVIRVTSHPGWTAEDHILV